MRKSENLCNLGENNTIDSKGSSSSKSSNSDWITRNTSRREESPQTDLIHAKLTEVASSNECESARIDLLLAHELAIALRAQDIDRFFKVYDFSVPAYFDRHRVSAFYLASNENTSCVQLIFLISKRRLFYFETGKKN